VLDVRTARNDVAAAGGDPLSEGPSRYHLPGQIDELWILDVHGQLLVVDGMYGAKTPTEHEGFTGCVDLELASWMSPNNGPSGENAFRGYEGPGYSEEFWILDVEGTRLMIAAGRSPGSSSEGLALQQAIRLHPNRAMTGLSYPWSTPVNLGMP
jgi:hypothetical protein